MGEENPGREEKDVIPPSLEARFGGHDRNRTDTLLQLKKTVKRGGKRGCKGCGFGKKIKKQGVRGSDSSRPDDWGGGSRGKKNILGLTQGD